MSTPIPPTRALLFLSILYRKDKLSYQKIYEIAREYLGNFIIFRHPFCPMKKYYAKEMGDPQLQNRLFFFATNPVPRDALLHAKLWAQAEEDKHALNKKRLINIDTGLLALENLQLATGKNFSHRVYLGQNIFSDLTLIYTKGSFHPLNWSYADYSHPEMITFFNRLRSYLLEMLREESRCSVSH